MRTLSSANIQAMNASSTGAIYHCLITISHPTLPTPIRITSDAKPTVSNTFTFLPLPFIYQIPDDRSDQVPVGKIQFDNVDLTMIDWVRSIGNVPPIVLMQIVMGSSPDSIDVEWEMTLRNVNYDVMSVGGDLRFDEILDEPYPGDTVNPATLPAVFLMGAA
jgi:hypothetical protein